MATNENEIEIIVGDEAESKLMYESKESMLNESADKSDSGIQTEALLISDSNVDESVIMSKAEAKSTPVITKTKEKEYSMNDIFNFMRAMSDDIKQSVNIKLESSFDVVNNRFDSNDKKFDKLSNDFDNRFDKLSSDFESF